MERQNSGSLINSHVFQMKNINKHIRTIMRLDILQLKGGGIRLYSDFLLYYRGGPLITQKDTQVTFVLPLMSEMVKKPGMELFDDIVR